MNNTIYFDSDHLYSTKFLADVFGVSQNSIKNMIYRGELNAEKMSVPVTYKDGRHQHRMQYMITGSDVAKFLISYFKKNHKVVTKAKQYPYHIFAKNA